MPVISFEKTTTTRKNLTKFGDLMRNYHLDKFSSKSDKSK